MGTAGDLDVPVLRSHISLSSLHTRNLHDALLVILNFAHLLVLCATCSTFIHFGQFWG